MSKKPRDPKHIVIKDARLAFVYLTKARANTLDAEKPPKFSVTLLIKKNYPLDAIKKAMKAAIAEKWGAKVPAKILLPIKDGDTDALDQEGKIKKGFKGHYYFEATAQEDRRPGVLNQDGEPVDSKEAYAGCYADVAVNAFSWEFGNVKKGVSFGVNAVRLSDKVGEPFGAGGVTNPAAYFDDLEDGDEDEAESEDDSDMPDDGNGGDDDLGDAEFEEIEEEPAPPKRSGKPPVKSAPAKTAKRNFLD
jgi:hypothetical protein